MITVTATQMRSEIFKLLKQIRRGRKAMRVTTKEGVSIILPEEDYENLMETLELLSTPGLAKSIQKALAEIKQGKLYSLEEVLGKKH